MEGVVIVGSILLAFGLQAWWEGVQDQQQERAVLNSLLVDFEENRERIRRGIGFHERFQNAASDLLSISDDSSLVPRAEQIDSLLNEVFLSSFSLNVSDGSLQALFASGRLDIVRNEELRALLASWPSWVEENAEEESWISSDIQERLTPYLNSRVRARNVYSSEYGLPVVIPRLPAQDYGSLWSDPVFDNLVTYRVYAEGYALRDSRLLEEQIENVIELLRAELGR